MKHLLSVDLDDLQDASESPEQQDPKRSAAGS